LNQINRLSPYLSRRFRESLLAAGAAEAREFKRSKGQEPPLVEGALFYSLFEGASRCTAVEPEDGPAGAFRITLEYGDPKDKVNFTRWQDRALVVRERGRWVVDDLELLGDWAFGAKGKLSKILKDVAGQAPSGMGAPTPALGEK